MVGLDSVGLDCYYCCTWPGAKKGGWLIAPCLSKRFRGTTAVYETNRMNPNPKPKPIRINQSTIGLALVPSCLVHSSVSNHFVEFGGTVSCTGQQFNPSTILRGIMNRVMSTTYGVST